MLADILRGCRMEVAQAAEARVPLRVLDVESAQLLRRRGDTAACYVDLGYTENMNNDHDLPLFLLLVRIDPSCVA